MIWTVFQDLKSYLFKTIKTHNTYQTPVRQGATSGVRLDIWTFVASHSFFIYLKFPQPVAKDPLQAMGSQLRTAFPLSHSKPLAVKIGLLVSQE